MTSLCTSWTLFGRLFIIPGFLQYIPKSYSLDLGCPLFLSLSWWFHTATIIFRSGLEASTWLSVFYKQFFFSPNMIALVLAVCLGSEQTKKRNIKTQWKLMMYGISFHIQPQAKTEGQLQALGLAAWNYQSVVYNRERGTGVCRKNTC